MKIIIRHEINFITSTVTINIKKNELNWDVREYAFTNAQEMRLFITTIESTLMLAEQDWEEQIFYITE